MAQLIADRKDIDFVLYEQMGIESILKSKKFSSFNRKMFDMIAKEARSFALKEILPTYAEGDQNGAVFENGTVKSPECFHKVHKLYVENEWVALTQNPDFGGQGLPHLVAQVALEYIMGSNFSFAFFGILAAGAGKLIELGGTDDLKNIYLEKVYTGKWGATMLLTEPNAGSDVGALTTTAVKNDDGTYSIKGNKIFITNGDQDITDNVIHPVLARIEGAPDGTKGISLFLVPKYLVNEDGSLGEFNNVLCTGIEEKLGLHASPTCSMSLGDRGECKGYLLGEENKGMNLMFYMMNDVRLEVGMQALAHASAAYLYAVDYARERLQGRALDEKDPSTPQISIINHPDVKRMLVEMKSYVDGMRSFVYYIAFCFDMISSTEDKDEKEYYKGLIDLITPIAKAYNSEVGYDVCVQSMQIFGGYGYTAEYPIEQILRDCKIASIYEGTNGIQAMDLLGRKLGMKKGKVFNDFIGEMKKTITLAKQSPALTSLADKFETAIQSYMETALHVGKVASSPEFKTGFTFAHPFLRVSGDMVMSWMLLWRAAIAAPKLDKICGDLKGKEREQKISKDKNGDFYDGQIKTAEYFINVMLPASIGKMNGIQSGTDAVLSMSSKAFAS